MNLAKIVVVTITGLSAVATVFMTGKPRPPVTPGVAASTLVINLIIIGLVVIA